MNKYDLNDQDSRRIVRAFAERLNATKELKLDLDTVEECSDTTHEAASSVYG